MKRSPEQLRQDALAIWQAGVDAVKSERLVAETLLFEDGLLIVDDHSIPLDEIDRIVVVGGGKAGVGMAIGVEQAFENPLVRNKRLSGWINVPADCLVDEKTTKHIHLHAARPAGVNEPTEDGVRGTEKILQLIRSLGPRDLCIVLISGGGSALLPAPVENITLADKQQVTKFLSGAGANIAELNTVRKQLSRIKGGGLLEECNARSVITLIISDVIGDPLDVIASGPTVANTTTAADALQILESFEGARREISSHVFDYLQQRGRLPSPPLSRAAVNLIIGNNAVAVDAAGIEAERRGYSHAMSAATTLEGEAEAIGVNFAKMAIRMRDQNGPDCLITGGEPVVQLADASIRGKGGRNQQLVLAAMKYLQQHDKSDHLCNGIALLSGGTDGEDGPTDAAGAIIDRAICQQAAQLQLDVQHSLNTNDAYTFFQQLKALIQTGPTHTNVCDLRVCVVERIETRRG
ncbi:MAG: glycerate 2-kinase [Pirellulaceae bacterium]